MQAKEAATEFRPPFELAGSDPTTKRLGTTLRYAETLIERVLQKERSAARLVSAVQKVEALTDSEIAKFQSAAAEASDRGRGDPIRCSVGCCHCCYRVPEASIPEVAAIWEHIETHFTDDEKQALRGRVEEYVQETHPLRPGNLHQAHYPCPLLVDSKCSVYDARPLSCRGLNSTNVAACEAIRLGREAPSQRPGWPDQNGIATVARMGIRLGAFFESLEPPTVDVGHALHVLFQAPTACDQYIEGKDRFIESRASSECEGFDATRISLENGPAFRSERELSLPSGNVPFKEAVHFAEQNELILKWGRFQDAMQGWQGRTPSRMISRIGVPRVASSEREIDESRENFLRAIEAFEEAHFAPSDAFNALSLHQTMSLAYQGRDDLELMRKHGLLMVEGISAKALPEFARAPEGKRRPGKLRVGYLSGNLNSSNGGRWAWTWVKHQSDEIETFCLLTGIRSDGITDRMRLFSEHFYWLNRSVAENAAFIRSLDLDVMIFTDIGLFGRNTQYSSLRLAPVQCTAWGHPVTSGLSTIDYYLSSEFMEPPDGGRFYTEELVRLPRAGLLFYAEKPHIPDHGRAHFGLPEAGRVILMGQSCMKLVPKFDYLYAEICDRTGAQIVFLESNTQGDTIILKERLKKAGVNAHWLPFMSNPDYMALMRLADVSIDPPMWSGGNSTVQALMLGTPVVTLPGPFMRSRHSLAFLRLANAPGLVARDEQDYIDLICDLDRIREASKDMDSGPIFGDKGTVRALDDFLLTAGARP